MHCQALDGKRGWALATVHNKADNAVIGDLIGSVHAWIGFNDIKEEGKFKWSHSLGARGVRRTPAPASSHPSV